MAAAAFSTPPSGHIVHNRLPRLISGGGFNHQLRSTDPPLSRHRGIETAISSLSAKPRGTSVKNLFSSGNHIRIKKNKGFVLGAEKPSLGICGDKLSLSSGLKSGVGGVRSKKQSSITQENEGSGKGITE